MATDATGTPSPNFGFAKYNTAVDTPSGKGFNAFVDDLDTKLLAQLATKVTTPVIQTYVPVWTSDGVAPALGNGVVVGQYIQVGKLVVGRAALFPGGTSTFGSGSYFLTIPPVQATAGTVILGNTRMFDTSAGSIFTGQIFLQTATTFVGITGHQPAQIVGSIVPFTWASGDSWEVTFSYLAA